MRTLAEALAEREFYARGVSAPTAEPTAPSRRAKGRQRAGEKLALLSGFQPPRVGMGDLLKKPAEGEAP